MFKLSIPTHIYFGRGCLKNAIEDISGAIKEKKVMVVTTGGSLYQFGYLDNLVCIVKKYALEVITYDRITANPKLSEIREGIAYGETVGAEVIIGFGGGSAMDASKAIAAGIGCDEDIEDMFYRNIEPSEKTLPIIAIPTTAGTGSELSKGAIISDGNIKKGIRGANIYPKIAIVDSSFTESIPQRTTLETGFDVFAHALESFVSKKCNRFSHDLSLKAIELTSRNLSILNKNIDDKSARENMSYASMIMGINLGNVGTLLPHRLQYPLGALTDTSHAAGLLALYPSWLELEWSVSMKKMMIASEIIKSNTGSDSEGLNVFLGFINDLAIRKNITQLNSGKTEKAEKLANSVTGSLENDPAYKGYETVLYIYKQSM